MNLFLILHGLTEILLNITKNSKGQISCRFVFDTHCAIGPAVFMVGLQIVSNDWNGMELLVDRHLTHFASISFGRKR